MDTGVLGTRVEQALSRMAEKPVRVVDVRPLHGGACQDNVKLDLVVDGDLERVVMRSDAATSLPGSLSRWEEFPVIQAAVKAGVPTPRARWLTQGLTRDGAHAYFLDWVEGEAIGRRVVKGRELATARERLPAELAAALVRIHSVRAGDVPTLAMPTHNGRVSAPRYHLQKLHEMNARLPEVHPAIDLALRWLADHVPPEVEPVLVHGDFRVGNFMVAPEGLRGVLDWEFAHLGDPHEDIAWLCVRDWRFGNNTLAAGGVCTRAAFYEAYAAASGRPVDAAAVHWWEVFGNLRWALGSVFQGERHLSGEERNLELLAIARRSVEMEWEALRLVEMGA